MTTIEALSQNIGINSSYLQRIIINCDKMYKAYYLRKKSGSNRRIEAPNRNLKAIQLWILRNILEPIKISEYAHGFIKKRGIKTNALYHLNKKYILTMDIKDFFPSITYKMIYNAFFDITKDNDISSIYAKLCTYKGRLPQGGVTSPFLSNIVFRQVDDEIVKTCGKMNITYSRYADDMSFSSNNIQSLIDINKHITKLIKSYGYYINNNKTRYFSGKNKMLVTGLRLNSGKLTTGRQRKRILRSAIYNYLVKNDNTINMEKVLGTISFIRDIEPEYYLKIKNYYKNLNNDHST